MSSIINPAVPGDSLQDATAGRSLTPLAELIALSTKRTRAVFLTENGESDFGGLERACVSAV